MLHTVPGFRIRFLSRLHAGFSAAVHPAEHGARASRQPEPVMTAGSYHRHAQLQGAAMWKALAYIREAALALPLPAAGMPLQVGG